MTGGEEDFAQQVRGNQERLIAALKPHYDFIVCGSGSSGSVAARRLAENPKVIPKGETITDRLAKFAAACGQVLARAHARSGDAAAIDDYLGSSAKVEQAFVTFASGYADQNERDHAQFARAVEQGSIPSAVGWAERR